MRICGISDIHGNLYNKIPECDVLCICGDIVPLNEQRAMDASATWWNRRFTKWAKELPCKKIIVVPGNHDFYLEKLYNEGTWTEAKEVMRELTTNKVEMLIDESYTYEGITFYGTPWIQPIGFQEGIWAFEYSTSKINDKLFEKIPKCDILLTHDNPNYNKRLGHCCFGKYKYHLYGHWHDGISYNHLEQYNCSMLDDYYNFKKDLKIVTIDIMTEDDIKKVEQNFLKKLIQSYKEYEKIDDAENKSFILGTLETDVADVIDFLESYLVDIPTDKEDKVEWDTSGSFCSDYNKEEDTPKLSFEFKETT